MKLKKTNNLNALQIAALLFGSLFLTACGGGGSASGTPGTGTPVVTANSDEAAGSNCLYGGTRIDSGLDSNDNGILDAPEVTDVSYICTAGQPFDDLVFLADTDVDEQSALYRADKTSNSPLLLAAPIAVGGSIVQFKISPDREKVAFRGDVDTVNVTELYTMNLSDGLPAVKVSGSIVEGGDITSFDWSPDSTMLAYRGGQDTADTPELYSVFLDGTNRTKVSGTMAAGGSVFFGFQWSPDSAQLLYRADQETDETVELYTVNANGTSNLKISGEMVAGGNVISHRWAPDGSRVAFTADREKVDRRGLYTVLPTGTNDIKVSGALIPGGSVGAFKWAPDSSLIAYVADQNIDGKRELFTADATVADSFILVSAIVLDDGDIAGVGSKFNWSPSNSRLAYIADQDVDNVLELYTVFSDGSNNMKVSVPLPDGDVTSFRWAPDGSRLAYLADQDVDGDAELYTVQPGGALNVKVSDTLVANGDVSSSYAWAPDSRLIAYRADQDTDNVFELYVTPPEGGISPAKISGSIVSDGNISPAFSWSPDSRFVAYHAAQDTVDVFELYTTDIDSFDNTPVSGVLTGNSDVDSFAWE